MKIHSFEIHHKFGYIKLQGLTFIHPMQMEQRELFEGVIMAVVGEMKVQMLAAVGEPYLKEALCL